MELSLPRIITGADIFHWGVFIQSPLLRQRSSFLHYTLKDHPIQAPQTTTYWNIEKIYIVIKTCTCIIHICVHINWLFIWNETRCTWATIAHMSNKQAWERLSSNEHLALDKNKKNTTVKTCLVTGLSPTIFSNLK